MAGIEDNPVLRPGERQGGVGLRLAIYPGTFDPPTRGHLDILLRAGKLFDKLIVAVAENPLKSSFFSAKERLNLLKGLTEGMDNVDVEILKGLLANYAQRKGAIAIVRGLRAISDFEYEFQMALTNRRLNPQVETVFLMPSENYTFLSSTLVKNIAELGGELSAFVPPLVAESIKRKLRRK